MLPTPPESALGKIMLFVVMGVAVVGAFTALWPIFLGSAVIYLISRMWSAWETSKLSPEDKAAAHQAACTAYIKQEEARKAFEDEREEQLKKNRINY